MKYDFTSIMDRRGKDALAIDSVGEHIWGSEPEKPEDGFDFIPMWVADMNFPTCPSITESIAKRFSILLSAISGLRKSTIILLSKWQKNHFGVTGLTKEHIGYENGVHGFITSAVQVLSEPGDGILLHSPFYLGFREDIEGLGRTSVYSPLIKDDNGIWRMDYEDFILFTAGICGTASAAMQTQHIIMK